MNTSEATIDRLLTEIYGAFGFTDAQAQKVKSDIGALIKTRVIDALMADLKDDTKEAIKAKDGTLSLDQFENELARTLMSAYSKEQVAQIIQTVRDAVIGEYLNFMLTNSNDGQRQQLLDILSRWRSEREHAA